MQKPLQITIPEPCTQEWDTMTPCNNGRFCGQCQKKVIDFTTWSDAELYKYFDAHKNEHFCGRYMSTQLNRDINIPHQPHSALYKAFIALGLTLVFTQVPNSYVKAQTLTVIKDTSHNHVPDSTKAFTTIAPLPVTNVNEIARTTMGDYVQRSGSGGITVTGARSVPTQYIIDGVTVNQNTNGLQPRKRKNFCGYLTGSKS